MSESKTYVHTDANGAMTAGDAKVPLEGIVAAFEVGDSPEAIQRQYPALLLEEVYGAITYYLANRSAVSDYLKRQDTIWNSWRSKLEQNPDALVERLKAIRAIRPRQAS